MKIYNSDEDIIQNLKDAGCSNSQIQELLELYKQGKKQRIYAILDKHRKNILTKVHKEEKQIDCIDYFIYQMEREGWYGIKK